MSVQPENDYVTIAAFLKTKTSYRPRVMIVCGSGLSGLASKLSNTQTFNYNDIPNFPRATVQGHFGELVFGTLNGLEVVCMKGRFHSYEGYSMMATAVPVRAMRLLGAQLIIVTNAAGGLNRSYNIGDIMVIMDHISFPGLAGKHPLVGPNDDSLGPRFPSTSDGYDPRLQEIVMNTADRLGLVDCIRENGTYCFVSGPSYETKAESKLLHTLGGDAVGMSTIPEVIVAKHCGMAILGLSLITNKAVFPGDKTHPASHEEVLASVKQKTADMETLVANLVHPKLLLPYLNSLPEFKYDIPAYEPPTDLINRKRINLMLMTLFGGLTIFAVSRFFKRS